MSGARHDEESHPSPEVELVGWDNPAHFPPEEESWPRAIAGIAGDAVYVIVVWPLLIGLLIWGLIEVF